MISCNNAISLSLVVTHVLERENGDGPEKDEVCKHNQDAPPRKIRIISPELLHVAADGDRRVADGGTRGVEGHVAVRKLRGAKAVEDPRRRTDPRHPLPADRRLRIRHEEPVEYGPHLVEERRQQLREQLVGAHDDQHLPQKGVEGDGQCEHQQKVEEPVERAVA